VRSGRPDYYMNYYTERLVFGTPALCQSSPAIRAAMNDELTPGDCPAGGQGEVRRLRGT